MAIWTAKKFKLPNMNFEATAIRFDDGRVGLCYHGRTIWQEQDGGWDESISGDWQTVWKYGRLCAFSELPEDMRLTCPKCGHKVGRDDHECLYCGIVLSKASVDVQPAPTAVEEPPAEQTVKGRSRMVDAALIALVLVITGGIVYNLTRTKEVEQSPGVVSVPAAGTIPAEQPRRPASDPGAGYDYGRREQTFPEGKMATAEMPAWTEPEATLERPEPAAPVEEAVSSDFYGHIDLNDPVKAHAAMQAEIKKLEQDRQQLEQERDRTETMEENLALRKKMLQYNAKRAALQSLINDYKARYNP